MTNPIIWLLAFGHLVVDMGQGAVPVLLPLLKDTFHLSYAAVALVTLVTNVSSSVIQPFFGVLSDRVGTRWLLPVGCLLTTAGLAVTAFAPSFAIVLLAIFASGLGIAAYHPEGSRVTFFATRAGRASSMAVFAIGGNLGFALGPLATTVLVGAWGHLGVTGLLLPGLAGALLLWSLMPAINRATAEKEAVARRGARVHGVARGQQTDWGALTLLTGVVTARSFIHAGMIAFIPLYFVSHLGRSPLYASHLLTLFLLAGVAGTLTGGPLADRWGRRRLLLLSFGASIPFLVFFPYADGIWRAVAVFGAGFAIIATFSVTVVFAQELAPNNVGLASGIMMGFAVGMGGVGVVLLGAIADRWGVPATLNVLGVLPVLALFLTLALPRLHPAEGGGRGAKCLSARDKNERAPLPEERSR
ncbi:MAG: MFS transporter [Thermoanaerobacterales bacterium]|nr:MFS transporter [Bacillota bacterium]MDI6906614.1 MFS transporter [Thermoanaerobacterales bacterium]